ncbi:non-canonical purine NTP pyrophosphatase [Estrella lausannensis]|uniref:Putative nucleoside-triphosphatase n=1 Tax=Estrella lausannensis TaxID=483423 RepID=A0A0H5E745_9BACT|nr:non-canonical purine NTP pyrophosphatase [Estrella lausannensis]CRX39135.1 Putative nucleoside-triphosphatase [Estrella lausannensis]
MKQFRLNTSNQGKFKEFERLFAAFGISLEATHIDLKEIAADPLSVIVHKASVAGERVIVDDTSLDVEGEAVGVYVRSMLDELPRFIGKRVHWRVLLAYREENQVFVFAGELAGVVVSRRGSSGFGFDPYFLPEGEELTLAESKPDSLNARAMAVKALMQGKPFKVLPANTSWDGSWQ